MNSDPILAYYNETCPRQRRRQVGSHPRRVPAPIASLRARAGSRHVVFFGSARLRESGPFGRYYKEARDLARMVTEWSLSLPFPAKRNASSCARVFCPGG